MTLFLFTCIIFSTINITFAQTTLLDKINDTRNIIPKQSTTQIDQDETAYMPPMPFSSFALSYQYDIQRLYESLSETKDTTNIPGTTALVNAELKNILHGKIQWEEKNNPNGIYWTGTNLIPIGKHKIAVRNLGTNYYFWYIYGKVQFSVHKNWGFPSPPLSKTTQNYFLILHFPKDNARPQIDYFTVGDAIISNNTQTLNAISKEATAQLAKANQEAYDKVKAKNEWTIGGKTETGNFESYRKGRVILSRNNGTMPYDISRFSYDDQLLIRGYLDHQGLSVR